jgi:hypothetical protein
MVGRFCSGRGRVAVASGIAASVTLFTSACGMVGDDVERTRAEGGATTEDGGRAAGSGGVPGAGGAVNFGSGGSPLFGTGGEVVAPSCPSDPDATRDLSPYALWETSDLVQRTLYSWTSTAQIDELRDDPTLLTRAASAGGDRGRAADVISSLAGTSEIAELLDRPEFERKRFGWPNAWATARGWPGETYGDQLLEIRLREDAWIVRMTYDENGGWQFAVFDMRGIDVPTEDVIANPERIAAIYFSDGNAWNGCRGTLAGGTIYREYVICNERMVESWSALTPGIRAHLEGAIEALVPLGEAFTALPDVCLPLDKGVDCFALDALNTWRSSTEEVPGLLETYLASLCFPNELYLPTRANLDALIAKLRASLFEPDPLSHTYPTSNGDAGP